jgi:hypothetical protein
MATNWPPANPYPSWPPAELGTGWLSFSDIKTGIAVLTELGFTRSNPTAKENNDYFKQVKCDEGHPCSGIMIVSPLGVRYPFAYCTGATHKSALVLWIVGYDVNNNPCYDLGWNSGAIV